IESCSVVSVPLLPVWTELAILLMTWRRPRSRPNQQTQQKGGLPLLLILSHRTRRQGAPLLTRFALSSTRRVACGQPVTAALRWDPSGLGQSRPKRPENDDVEPKSLFDQDIEQSRPGAIHRQRELVSARDQPRRTVHRRRQIRRRSGWSVLAPR